MYYCCRFFLTSLNNKGNCLLLTTNLLSASMLCHFACPLTHHSLLHVISPNSVNGLSISSWEKTFRGNDVISVNGSEPSERLSSMYSLTADKGSFTPNDWVRAWPLVRRTCGRKKTTRGRRRRTEEILLLLIY